MGLWSLSWCVSLLETLTPKPEPFHFSALPQPWVSDAMKNKRHPHTCEFFIQLIAQPCKEGEGWRTERKGRENIQTNLNIQLQSWDRPEWQSLKHEGWKMMQLAVSTCYFAIRMLQSFCHPTTRQQQGAHSHLHKPHLPQSYFFTWQFCLRNKTLFFLSNWRKELISHKNTLISLNALNSNKRKILKAYKYDQKQEQG